MTPAMIATRITPAGTPTMIDVTITPENAAHAAWLADVAVARRLDTVRRTAPPAIAGDLTAHARRLRAAITGAVRNTHVSPVTVRVPRVLAWNTTPSAPRAPRPSGTCATCNRPSTGQALTVTGWVEACDRHAPRDAYARSTVTRPAPAVTPAVAVPVTSPRTAPGTCAGITRTGAACKRRPGTGNTHCPTHR